MAEDDQEKTEEPTNRKLHRARQEGQVATSQELKSWAILAAALFLMMTILPGLLDDLAASLSLLVRSAEAIPMDREHLRLLVVRVVTEVVAIMWPVFVTLVIVAVLINLVQTGLMWSPKKLMPQWNKISPISGFKRLFSTKSLVEMIKGMAKVGAVVLVAAIFVVPLVLDIEVIPGFDLSGILDRLEDLVLALIGATVAVMAAISLLDFIYQHYSFMKGMRMTKTEVKDEHKQTEGDPQVRSRIRSLRVQRARERMMAAVPKADVVITNPTHYAVALAYEMEEMAAPILVAKGVDELAQRIRSVAEEHDVPVIHNPPLAQALYATVEIDQEIPQEHYKAVAEIIGFVMRMKGNSDWRQPVAGAGP